MLIIVSALVALPFVLVCAAALVVVIRADRSDLIEIIKYIAKMIKHIAKSLASRQS